MKISFETIINAISNGTGRNIRQPQTTLLSFQIIIGRIITLLYPKAQMQAPIGMQITKPTSSSKNPLEKA